MYCSFAMCLLNDHIFNSLEQYLFIILNLICDHVFWTLLLIVILAGFLKFGEKKIFLHHLISFLEQSKNEGKKVKKIGENNSIK